MMRLKNFEPPEGYYLAFSGGKDSVALLDLAKRAEVNFDAHYNLTTIDPPEVVQFIKTFAEVAIERPPKSMYKLVVTHGLPIRRFRWCCKLLKECGGAGRYVLTGVRWQEAKGRTRRAHRGMTETCYTDNSKHFIHPIIDWSNEEVWEYIKTNNLRYCSLYDEGFERLGCVLCPMASKANRARELERFPKIAKAWRRAAGRTWNRQTPGMQKFKSAEEYWQWWLSRKTHQIDDAQMMMFDSDD